MMINMLRNHLSTCLSSCSLQLLSFVIIQHGAANVEVTPELKKSLLRFKGFAETLGTCYMSEVSNRYTWNGCRHWAWLNCLIVPPTTCRQSSPHNVFSILYERLVCYVRVYKKPLWDMTKVNPIERQPFEFSGHLTLLKWTSPTECITLTWILACALSRPLWWKVIKNFPLWLMSCHAVAAILSIW